MAYKVLGVEKTLKDMKLQFIAQSQKEIRTTKRNLLNNLRNATPVDTGKARDGWYQIGDSIRNDVDYVFPLNYGTSTREPRLFIESAVLETKDIRVRGSIVKSR